MWNVWWFPNFLTFKLCNYLDRYLLWSSIMREILLSSIISRYALRLFKWMLHLATGQSELRRLLSQVHWQRLEGGQRKPKAEMVIWLEIIWQNSSILVQIGLHLFICLQPLLKKEKIKGKILEKICLKLANLKMVPIRG